ncbi:unnamed protein product [Protopolystoma xenopodis]|uniref:Uncharacterized protein n=1 Tax=Protopolystoma xenopodis TaxID=117903 RepID=A0A448XM35_9PLAT|nr:unnamed protein product [Protopolystoma xenopodis]
MPWTQTACSMLPDVLPANCLARLKALIRGRANEASPERLNASDPSTRMTPPLVHKELLLQTATSSRHRLNSKVEMY